MAYKKNPAGFVGAVRAKNRWGQVGFSARSITSVETACADPADTVLSASPPTTCCRRLALRRDPFERIVWKDNKLQMRVRVACSLK